MYWGKALVYQCLLFSRVGFEIERSFYQRGYSRIIQFCQIESFDLSLVVENLVAHVVQ